MPQDHGPLVYGDNGKENGNYYAIIGFRVEGLGIEDGGCLQLCVQNVPLGGSLSVAATQCRTGKRSRCRPLWISNSTDTASAQGLGFRALAQRNHDLSRCFPWSSQKQDPYYR